MELRPYQLRAVDDCAQHFLKKCEIPAIAILPTGAGKSIIIAEIIKKVGGKFLVLQPNKEILEQNIEKYRRIGPASIYSAILKKKEKADVVFATIGSIVYERIFDEHRQIIVDECHCVNPEAGMYQHFLGRKDIVVLGLTATPYRLKTSGNSFMLEFITRQRPGFFGKVIHVTQQSELLKSFYLSKLVYKEKHEVVFENVKMRGMEYCEKSLLKEFKRIKIQDLILKEIEIAEKEGKKCLVFVQFIEILQELLKKKPSIRILSGTTPQEERRKILEDFKEGKISTVANVGVLTTGFDYPALNTIIIARATRSLSLWYQMCGRGQRISEGKNCCQVVDICGNLNILGDVQTLETVLQNGSWFVTRGNQKITNKTITINKTK